VYLSDGRRLYSYSVGQDTFLVFDGPERKSVRSPAYNYDLDKTTGRFVRWGRTLENDPPFSPIGPEILDIEISVNGCRHACPFCYKNNTAAEPINMTFDMFKAIIDKIPQTLTQVAFGITDVGANPDFIRMMTYCREIGVVPNFTLSGGDLTDDLARRCAALAGAIAVSVRQDNKGLCYETVQRLTSLGLKQTNIHILVSRETLPFVHEVVADCKSDPRLQDLNALVLLSVKPKGRAKGRYHPLSSSAYDELIQLCWDSGIRFGFDSCSAPYFERFVETSSLGSRTKQHLIQCSESCESFLFSCYIDVHGQCWPCSFAEGEDRQKGISVVECGDFLSQVWYADTTVEYRRQLLNYADHGCRPCPLFEELSQRG